MTFNIESGTWDMKPKERVDFARKTFDGRPVSVKEGTVYTNFIIAIPNPTEVKRNIAVQKALDKLTSEDRKVLD